jgi:AraC-like DNA-binding protein
MLVFHPEESYITQLSPGPELISEMFKVKYMTPYLSHNGNSRIFYQEMITNTFKLLLLQWQQLDTLPGKIDIDPGSMVIMITLTGKWFRNEMEKEPGRIYLTDSANYRERFHIPENVTAALFICIPFHVLPAKIKEIISTDTASNGKLLNRRTYSVIDKMLNTHKKDLLLQLGLQSCIISLLSLYKELYADETPAFTHQLSESNRKRIIDYIKQEIGNNKLSIQQVARHMYMSERAIQLSFKETFNITLKKFIRNRRLEIAYELLKETNLTIESICVDTGFSDPSYFTKVFKEYFGILPKSMGNARKK